jgi:uncharacterized protein
MMGVARLATALGFLSMALAGCGSLEPRPDPTRYFTLSPIRQAPEAQAKPPDGSAQVWLGLGPIRLPGYLDRQEIVVRSGENRFDVSEIDRWAEPLDENFARVVAQNLAVLLGTGRIVFYPWPRERMPKYQVAVEVFRFETNGARDAQLEARWAILDANSKKPLRTGDSRVIRTTQEKSTDGSVAALSESLGTFSRELADAIKAMEGSLTP